MLVHMVVSIPPKLAVATFIGQVKGDLRRYGEEQMAISRYRLQSRPVDQKQGALRIGAVGRVTYTSLRQDRYWQGVMGLLADFALYSGVGVQTTTGMGQTRRIE
jgi:CRISPR-associated endoribonuclease Cas6